MKKNLTRYAAAVLAASMTVTAAPAVYAADTAAEGKIVYSFDFEDGDVSAFTNRGGDDTTEISITEDFAQSGSKALLASGRSQEWNGPAFRLDDKLEPNTEYTISAKIKGRYYTNATLSYQYTVDGETKYNNLKQNINGADWQTVEDVKISYSDEMEGVYVYFEGGMEDIIIDDFVIREVPSVDIQQDIKSLSKIFGNDFKVGTAITPSDLSSKPTMALIKKHFGQSITVGNEMKPDSVLNKEACLAYLEETGDDTAPQISFSAAKPVLNYCRDNNIPVRVHTLVWHSQTPDWFFKENYDEKADYVSPEKMLKRMENYIKIYFETLTKLYPTVNFYACDVVNEAWLEDGTPRKPGHPDSSNGYGASDWVAVFGDNSFIDYAFEYARQYAPEGCKLYYNDYNEYMDKKTKIIEMAERLKAKGVIDGIGMQSHLDARQSLDAAFPSVQMYEAAVRDYVATGLDVQITELDATVNENSGTTLFDNQAAYYKGIMSAIEKYKDNISAVIFWGITDDKSWRATQSPLLFDGEYKAKPAFDAIVEGHEENETTINDPKPVESVNPTQAPTEAPTSAPTDAPTSAGNVVYGDANCDGRVTVADATAILQAIGNPDKYDLSEQGKKNADCYEPGSGITGADASAIQKLDAKAISSLPEYAAK